MRRADRIACVANMRAVGLFVDQDVNILFGETKALCQGAMMDWC